MELEIGLTPHTPHQEVVTCDNINQIKMIYFNLLDAIKTNMIM